MGVSTAFFARFKKVMALVGSDREHERHAAADKAFELCRDNDLSFLEALDGAFGTSGGNEEELLRRIGELEDDNRKLAEAVELLNAQHHVIPDNAGQELFRKLWSYPVVRLLWTVFAASGFLWAIPAMMDALPGSWSSRRVEHVLDCIFGGGTLLYFWDWAVAEFSRRGIGAVVMKGVFVVVAILVAVFDFHETPATGLFILVMTAAIAATNALTQLLDALQHSDNWFCEGIRSWFV